MTSGEWPEWCPCCSGRGGGWLEYAVAAVRKVKRKWTQTLFWKGTCRACCREDIGEEKRLGIPGYVQAFPLSPQALCSKSSAHWSAILMLPQPASLNTPPPPPVTTNPSYMGTLTRSHNSQLLAEGCAPAGCWASGVRIQYSGLLLLGCS